MDRRTFVSAATLGIGASWLPRCLGAATESRARIEVLLNEPVGTISPDLYGYLLEDLGTVIYDGVWVGPDSKIPHYGGIRKEFVDRLRAIKASVIRWPGGDYADHYDWTDGVGPSNARPRRSNKWANYLPPEVPAGPQRYDPNQFGTPEFMRLCKLTGGRPYLSVNARSLRAQDFSRWVEYCNSPAGSTMLADLRKADGSVDPYGVRYWGIGNEPWAAGGELTVEEYVTDYKRFTSEVPNYGMDLAFIACGGPPGASTQWVSDFLRLCSKAYMGVPVFAMSIHYYATFLNDLPPGEFADFVLEGKDYTKLLSDALQFGPFEWYDALAKSTLMKGRIESTWRALKEAAPKRTLKVAVDEWGCMYRSGGTALSPANLTGRAVTMRDALTAAITLNILNSECDKVALANFTGLINQEGGIFRAEGDHFICTPVYHVFNMYAAHQGGQALRTVVEAASVDFSGGERPISMDGLLASSSVQGHDLTVTIVNPHISEAREPTLNVRGGDIASATWTVLSDGDIHAQNTAERPSRVQPKLSSVSIQGSTLRVTAPPASVGRLAIRLR